MARFVLGAAAFAAATLGSVLGVSAASSATYSYDFTNKGTNTYSSHSFSSTSGTSTLNVKVSAWHAGDANGQAVTTDAISAATLGIWSDAGMGVLYGSDSTSTGTHQIDNVGGGVDFLMLQFSQDVTLSSISRNVYAISGVHCCDSDAAWWADTGNKLGAPSSTASIDLTRYAIDESTFTAMPDSGKPQTAAAASVWLISAAFNQSNDGFKLSGMTVNTASQTPAVPEPASWAMMLSGFGVVGVAMRRRKPGLAAV